MSEKKQKLNDIFYLKNLKYNWHEDPYSYYKLAKEIDLPYNLYELFSSNIKDPQEEDENNKLFYKNNTNNNKLQIKKIDKQPKLCIPIIETILFENGQITGWIYNDRAGYVSKKPLKKLGTDNLIQYFLSKILSYCVDGEKIFRYIPESKVLIDLPKYATYIVQKKEVRDEKIFKNNNLEYIYEMEKIKFILIYYYSDKEPILIDFISFYFLLNEHGGINAIKMMQNLLNCKLKSLPTSSSFVKKHSKYSENINNSEKLLRQITVKYSKTNELEKKKFYIFYDKPKIVQPTFSNNILNNVLSTTNFYNFSPTYNYPNSKFRPKYKSNQKIYINAETKNNVKKNMNSDLKDKDRENINNSQEKLNIFKKSKINKFENNNNLDDSIEKKFKYYLKGGKKNDGKILGHMDNIEDNLIVQNNDILTGILSNLAEKLVKYIEKSKNMIIIYAYFIFVKIDFSGINEKEFYAFQKCLLIYGIDKNEAPVLEKTYSLKQNMKNIIYKRIPEDVSKFKNFEKFTKNDFCHGEFCNYIVPNFFKGIKEQQLPKNLKIPKENQISIRGKNNELPGKIPLFEIKKVYDNPELTNLVLKSYSIFPPSFNKEYAIEKLIKERNKKLFQINDNQNNENNHNEEEETKKNIRNIGDEYGSIMDSTEKIAEKIQEYENEFKQEIIVYTPTPGKFLHVDYNDMYTEKGVCEKCYKIYTIILQFMKNIDECTAEFKSLIKAKQFLIKGENLRVSNFEDKNTNDNNLVIQEELGKMSVKKFLGIKILKLRMEELNKYKKKQKTRIERNLVTHKQELNKTFNYNLQINLKLLLANLLAEKTNNQFFNVLFTELYNEDDTVFKHLDIKKPKITFEKTNMKDLRLQMGISSMSYNPNFLSKNNIRDKNTKNSFIHKIIKNNLEKQKNNEIINNIQQQIWQVDKNLFQEYNYLCGLNDNNNENNINNKISDENSERNEKNEKLNNSDKNKIIDEVFEYFRIPTLSRIRLLSGKKKKEIVENEQNLRSIKSAKNKQVKILLKNYKNKKMTIRKKMSSKKEKEAKKNIYNYIPIKSLEEIKKQKEKQLEEFLRFDPKKFHRKKNNENNNNYNFHNRSFNSDYSSNSNEDSNKEKKSKNTLALLFEDDNWEYYDSDENSSNSDAAKWDKDKVVLTSLFYNKTAKEFQDINKMPYFYITTPFPKIKDFNSTQRINENPLEILRKMNFKHFSGLGNFFNENLNENEINKKIGNINNGKNMLEFDSKNTKIYADDNFTAVPYEILDYNDLDKNEDKIIKKKSASNNINISKIQKNDKRKYIVFVINDFFDTYIKYKYYFNLVLLKLKCYQNLSIKNELNEIENSKNQIKDIKNNPLKIINSKNFKISSHNLFIRKPVNILTTKNSTISKDIGKNINTNTSSDNKTEKNNSFIIQNENEEEKKDNNNKENKMNLNNKNQKEKISELKFVLFNLPGQSTTLFTKKVIQNNIFYSEFLDRFIYYLYQEKEFDLSYKIILLGFGNGGHIALTYASLYEKYWNILDSIIMFNGYCKNGPIINETMLEVLKIIIKENNPKTIDFFIRQSTHNPKEFNAKENEKNNKKNKKNFYGFDDEYMELQKKIKKIDNFLDDKNKKQNKSYNKKKSTFNIKKYNPNEIINNKDYENEDAQNNMTLDGYKLITKGYFYNIQINLKEIATKILCVHSNVDSFINIHNIAPLFDNDISSYHVTPLKELFSISFKNNNNINVIINKDKANNNEDKKDIENKNPYKYNSVMGYNLDNFKNKENNNRKLIIFDGSHDVSFSNEKDNIICSTLISYFS